VELLIACGGAEQHIEVRDRGGGMSQTVLSQALSMSMDIPVQRSAS
jgi:hypothetical protein